MPEDVTPEPRSLRAVGPADEPRERFAAEHKRRAMRTATTIVSENMPTDAAGWLGVVALAWSQGYLEGTEETFARVDAALNDYRKLL